MKVVLCEPKHGRSRGAAMILAALGLAAVPGRAGTVTVEYQAEARTITGQPFGMAVPFLTPVSGYLTYESDTPDRNSSDPTRGKFLLAGTWEFRAEFLGRVVTGSGTATATTNLYGSPTLAFNDGGDKLDRGIMRIDGLSDPDVELGLSISGASKDLPTDRLPASFTFDPPPNGAPHTFVLKDDSGQMNLRFLSFGQMRPEIVSIGRNGDEVSIVWSSVLGKPYALEFSTDLEAWTVIRSDLVGMPQTTSVVDDLAARYPAIRPSKGFYRILDRVPLP